ncbi:tetratricopeptide repeat protein [Ectothiorhodospiraceae bacterium WFHF3C12]|nr:tetratricopeptide repeat protein [Ectothiorhodospiraceae bacterium WFHF3C12]
MNTRRLARLIIWVMLMGLVAGCSVAPRDREPPPSEQGDLTSDPQRPLKGGEAQVPEVVVALVSDANAASSAGDHEQAAVRLERAIRIAPRNAALWQNLAVVRYRQERYAQAESLALKSNSLTADAGLKRQNWLLVAEARRAMGDEAGAREAEAEAKRFAERAAGR